MVGTQYWTLEKRVFRSEDWPSPSPFYAGLSTNFLSGGYYFFAKTSARPKCPKDIGLPFIVHFINKYE